MQEVTYFNKSKSRKVLNEYLYIGYVLLIGISKYFGMTSADKEYIIITMFACLLVVLKILLSSYTRKELLIIGLIVSISVISTVLSKREGLLLSVLAIIGIKRISISKVSRYMFNSCATVYLAHIILSQIGLITDYSRSVMRFDGREWISIIRSGLGYEYSNITFVMLFTLIVYFIYQKKGVIKNIQILIGAIIVIIVYFYTYSRSGFLVSLLLLMLLFIEKNIHILRFKVIRFITITIFAICSVLSVVFSYIYSPTNNFLVLLNKLFSGRLALGQKFLDMYDLKLLGQEIAFRTSINNYMVLDAFYLNGLLSNGLIVMCIYLIFTCYITNYLIKNEDYMIAITMIPIAVYGLSETFLFNFILNPSILLAGLILYRNQSLMKNNFIRS